MKQKLARFLVGILVACSALSANAQFVNGQVLTATQLINAFSNTLQLTGGTLTGPLTVPSLSVTGSPIGLASGGTGATTATGATSQFQYLQGGTGSVARSLTAKFQDYVYAQDYGVKCDNSTVNTTMLQAALTAAQNASKPLYIVGQGTCLTDWINYGSVPLANQVGIFGDGVTLQKITADGNPVMTIGSATATSYTGPIVIRGVTFSGIPGNSPAALMTYDVVRSSFENVGFQSSIVGNYSYGGISNDYRNAIFDNNEIGWRGDTFSSLAGGGVPNLITFDGSKFVNNSLYGGYFNGGNSLFVKNFDIEGNGTTGTSGSGGFYVSPVSTGVGAVFDSGWFEANAGGQNLWLNGGHNDVRSAMFIASPNATNDINITGGTYSLKNVQCVNTKTPNINETSSSAGNSLQDVNCPNITTIAANTALINTGGVTSLPTNVAATGQFTGPNGSAGTPTYSFANNPTSGLYLSATSIPAMSAGGAIFLSADTALGTRLRVSSLGWAATTLGTSDTFLERDSAGVLALRNSTTAQMFRVYGSTTGPKYVQLWHDGTNGNLDTSASSGVLNIAPTNAASVAIGKSVAVTGAITATTTGAMPLYGTTGTAVNAPHMVSGSVALASGTATVTLSGSAVFTSSSTYTCTANDTTAANAVKVALGSGTSITLTGTGTDTVAFMCAGD